MGTVACAALVAVIVGIVGDGAGVAFAANRPPAPPVLVSPQDGAIANVLRPPLVIHNAIDPDGDPLVYDWDLAGDPTFATILESGLDRPPQGAPDTTFALTVDLTEDEHYCWRARSNDGQARSTYNVACFVVSEHNDPPSVPILNNPSDTRQATTTTPVFSWAPSTDPEGQPISYEIEVRGSAGIVVGTVTGVTGTLTSIAAELTNCATYSWRARATDVSGASSEFSPDNTFIVHAPTGRPWSLVCEDRGCDGEVCDYEGGDTCAVPPPADNDDCQSSSAPGSGSMIALGVVAFGVRRRRRRGQSRVRR